MDAVEITQLPIAPEAQKTLTPAAVSPARPSLFRNPDREGSDSENRKKRKSRRDREPDCADDSPYAKAPARGLHIDIRA